MAPPQHKPKLRDLWKHPVKGTEHTAISPPGQRQPGSPAPENRTAPLLSKYISRQQPMSEAVACHWFPEPSNATCQPEGDRVTVGEEMRGEEPLEWDS